MTHQLLNHQLLNHQLVSDDCDSLLNPHAASQELQVSSKQLLDLINRAALPAYDLGGHIRFRRSEITRYQQRQISSDS